MLQGCGSTGREGRRSALREPPLAPGDAHSLCSPHTYVQTPGATMRGQQWAILPDLASRPFSRGKGQGRGARRVFTGQTCTRWRDRQRPSFPSFVTLLQVQRGLVGGGPGYPVHTWACVFQPSKSSDFGGHSLVIALGHTQGALTGVL